MKQDLKIKVSQYSSMSQKSLDFQPKFNTKVEYFSKSWKLLRLGSLIMPANWRLTASEKLKLVTPDT
jgi:hypothetical protein